MRLPRWQLIVSLLMTCGVLILAYIYRARIWSAVELVREIQLRWLALALGLELFSFFCASQVYYRSLRSLGYRMSPVRLWMVALVAIILSQSFPAGGVASYAFLVQVFRRRGIPAGHSTLVASLEALSYAVSMLLLFGFSLLFLALNSASGSLMEGSIFSAGIAIVVIGSALFLLTREQAVLTRWLLGIKNGIAGVLRRQWSDAPIHKLVDELGRGRELFMSRRAEVVLLVLIQIAALIGHSMVMLVILHSLGTRTTVLAVMAAFGIALITSTFNVLPGGGGTVETALALSLSQLGVGDQSITAAVVFRILNFWFLLPFAAIGYRWLMHGSDDGPS